MIQKTTSVMMERLRRILSMEMVCSQYGPPFSQLTYHLISLSLSLSLSQQSQQSQVSGADRQHLADLESLLCATLQSLVRKVNKEDAITIAPSVMEALMLMFQASASGSSSGVLEDAIMTVGVLVEGGSHDMYKDHVICRMIT